MTEDGHWDLGGMWVSTFQPRIMQLLSELGLTTYPQYVGGKKVIHVDSQVKTYTGLIPPISIPSLIETEFKVIRRIQSLMDSLPPDASTWSRAAEFDRMSVGAWAFANLYTTHARKLLDVVVHTLMGCQSDHISMLDFLDYCRTAGSWKVLLETEAGAQQQLVHGGTQQISERMAEELREKGTAVHLGATVNRIVSNDTGVTVTTTEGLQLTARYCVVATAPSVYARISFEPMLSPIRQQMTKFAKMGCYTKILLEYERPFWREAGLCGEVLVANPTPQQPIVSVYDHCVPLTPDNDPNNMIPCLCAFVCGDAAIAMAELPVEERKKRVLDHLNLLVGGPENLAYKFTHYREKQWILDPYAGGCPVNVFPSFTFSQYASMMGRREGRFLFGATETARQWRGYMHGALEAGERVAKEVAELVQGHTSGAADTEREISVEDQAWQIHVNEFQAARWKPS
eukprot:c13392_g1_i1.p1 GENE.c13392_g1_i1~~c13392_g1_i1.p1  ORF type:complete len:509 (-),score=94.29 c13392_g1_i1:85-1455(-)